jgi:hypothetical protein
MISVICVFNDLEVLRRRLLSSLASQTARHEVITVDNRDSRFDRAATALNWGAAQASGRWLLFVHQDIEFLSPEWLARAQTFLEEIDSGGWCGVAGMTRSGRFRGVFKDRAAFAGAPFGAPLEVQTLDECVLMCRREVKDFLYFDEEVPGWHAYGVEACCAAIRKGATNYVLPLPIWHDSKSTNLQGLEVAHTYVWQKHGDALKRIPTTCGDLPTQYGWAKHPCPAPRNQFRDRVYTSYYHRLGGHPNPFHNDFHQQLEALTEAEDEIECLHTDAWHSDIEAQAFVPRPQRRRRVRHRFGGWRVSGLQVDCIMVAADLTVNLNESLENLDPLFERARRFLICINWDDALMRPKLWRKLKRRSSRMFLTRQWDETRYAILELSPRGSVG